MKCSENLRIAWLLPSAFFYWQPVLSEFTKLFPNTVVYTGRWHGFAPGFENTFAIQVVGERKNIAITPASTGYGSTFSYLSLKIVKYLLELKPHVVFSSSFGMWTVLALLLQPLGRWKVVIAYEGSSPSVDYRNSSVRLFLRRIMTQAASACITNSHAGKSYLIEFLGVPEDRIFTQPYEVPAAVALSGSNEPTEVKVASLKHPIFLFVGGVIPRKGLQLLLEACVILQNRGIHDYSLLIVGDGSQRQNLQDFVQQHHLEDQVEWAGRVEYGKLSAYFRMADVFVLPTLEDTWGMVVLEAMILGKPVLCSKWAGAVELVLDGENGYSFDPQEPQKLAELMHRFIENPDLIEAMGQRSQQLMMSNTPEDAAKFLAEVTSFAMNC